MKKGLITRRPEVQILPPATKRVVLGVGLNGPARLLPAAQSLLGSCTASTKNGAIRVPVTPIKVGPSLENQPQMSAVFDRRAGLRKRNGGVSN